MKKKQKSYNPTDLPPINQEELSEFAESYFRNKNNAEDFEDIKEGIKNKKKMMNSKDPTHVVEKKLEEDFDVMDEFESSIFKNIKPPKTHYSLKFLKNIIEYFDTYNQKQEAEAERILKELRYSDSQNEKFQRKLKELSHNKNPRIREKIAKMGFFGETLKYDPIAEIRRQVLITTGDYSEYYRERENSFSVIKEMIKQGIDYEFFANKDPFFSELVDEQKEVDIVLNELSNQNEQVLFYIIKDFSDLLKEIVPDSKEYNEINKTVEFLEFFYENQLNPKNIKTAEEVFEEKDIYKINKEVVGVLKVGMGIAVGEVVGISEDKINIKDFNGDDVEYSPYELSSMLEK